MNNQLNINENYFSETIEIFCISDCFREWVSLHFKTKLLFFPLTITGRLQMGMLICHPNRQRVVKKCTRAEGVMGWIPTPIIINQHSFTSEEKQFWEKQEYLGLRSGYHTEFLFQVRMEEPKIVESRSNLCIIYRGNFSWIFKEPWYHSG